MEKVSEKKLSSRELEVLKLIIKGDSNPTIAKELCVTEATIKAHVSHIFEKLKVQNRVQAAVLAFEEKLV